MSSAKLGIHYSVTPQLSGQEWTFINFIVGEQNLLAECMENAGHSHLSRDSFRRKDYFEMKMLKVVNGQVVDLSGCWNCGRILAPSGERNWPILRKNIEAVGWKTRLFVDFFDQERNVVENHQIWCPDCEEGSGRPPGQMEKLGCISILIVAAALLFSIGWLFQVLAPFF